MRSFKSIVRKKAKARARFKDYTRRKNINANVPTMKFEEKVQRFSQVKITRSDGSKVTVMSEGRPKLEHAGYKTKIMKSKQHVNHSPGDPSDYLRDKYRRNIGMIHYPHRRKYHEKKEKKTTA